VLKHIPGHGRAVADSHVELPRVSASMDELFQSDFRVFQALSDLPLGMTAHVVYEAISDQPGTLSPEVVRLIRRDLGFDGLLMTDDIAMGALPGPIGERAARARAAGCDLVLHCNGGRAEMTAVAASGPMAPEAARRAEAAIGLRSDPPFVDIARAREDFDAIPRSAS